MNIPQQTPSADHTSANPTARPALSIALAILFMAFAVPLQAKWYDVTDYGARADGATIDSPAINRAIQDAADHGGGTVYLPAGQYACYSIHLASHVNLYLEQGCTIIAAEPSGTQGYDTAEPNAFSQYQDYGHSHWHDALIWGEGLEDISISGPGRIWGRGLTRNEDRTPGVGNKTISLKLCHNVCLRDFQVLMGGHMVLLATGVDNLSIQNLSIDTNRDGLDIDCCKNVRISQCSVNSPWDDGIVLKATYALGYFRDTEDVTISDCFVSGYDRQSMLAGTWTRNDPHFQYEGFFTGRIKIGTESSGGFRNIAVTNCIFERCRGLALETVDGGVLEDVVISNITMREIVNAPLFLRLGARMRSPEGTPMGSMRRILISDINIYDADSRFSSIISGVPGALIEDVTLSNIHIWHRGGFTEADGQRQVPEAEADYPETWMFGIIPAKGFFIRHARRIALDGVHLHYAQPDGRPLMVTDDAEGITFNHITVDGQAWEP